ncbi:MAG: nucleotidyltransferase family protein [Bacillaceae bacterium]|nr:nucleotidyltransferase family protein [Bacillaceae bacterium]
MNLEKRLKQMKPVLQEKFHVKRIGYFGSYARGDQTHKSDVDILVEFSKPVGWEYIDLKEYLEKHLRKRVDLVTLDGLKPLAREEVLKEVIYL